MKFRKKPVVIDAFQYIGPEQSAYSLGEWWSGFGVETNREGFWWDDARQLHIVTLEDGKNREAKHIANPGDWIIRGIKGEFYACKPDIFAATYDAVEANG